MSQAPYGYTYTLRIENYHDQLMINEAEVEVVRMIFRWLIDDQLSTYQISNNNSINNSEL